MKQDRDTLFAFLDYTYLMILIATDEGRLNARKFYMGQAKLLITILYP